MESPSWSERPGVTGLGRGVTVRGSLPGRGPRPERDQGMRNIRVVRLKPNPTGKDRSRYGLEATQLVAEWVDIENLGHASATLSGVEVHHLAYPGGGGQPRWEKVLGLTGELGRGK